jgi:hypothetical protein
MTLSLYGSDICIVMSDDFEPGSDICIVMSDDFEFGSDIYVL